MAPTEVSVPVPVPVSLAIAVNAFVWALAVVLTATSAHAAGSDVAVRVERDGSRLQVEATMRAPASVETCWLVLTDFDRLHTFVPRLDESRILGRAPLLVQQIGSAGFGPLRTRIDVTLAVRLFAPSRIEFERVAGNLREMRGEWTIAAQDGGCLVAYSALIEPDFPVLPWIGPALMRSQIDEQLRALRDEIGRRAADPSAQRPPVGGAASGE